ncbi:MAG: pyridoxal phosphate-dependent aminotransferase [Candidatus Omnitrophota bacterium]
MIAKRLKHIKPSPTLAITSKAKKLKAEGVDIISLAAGEPDFDTPQFIKDAAIEAIGQGFTKYTPTSGTPELKKLIAEKFKKDNSLDYALDQIVVSCGAKHSIFNALFVLVDKDDEVLIPSPYWVSYPEMVHLCEGSPKFIEASPEDNFKITPEELKKKITSKTKVLILNSPSNPAGSVYSCAELKEIADICVKNKIFVISDEIYEKIIFDGLKPVSIASLGRNIYDLTITVNGLSKSFSMTGWRIGYLGAAKEIAEAVSKVQDHSTSNPNSIAQKAAVAALKASSDFSDELCQEFCKRRDYVISRLENMNKITFVKPEGAFYVFFDISKTGLDAQIVASRLLDEAKIAVIPGNGFGRKDYCRLSFATNIPQLEKAMDRLESWLNSLN